MSKNSIEVARFKEHRKGFLVGFVDLRIDPMGLVIHNCTFWTKEGRQWVNLPAEKYTNADGEEKHRPFVSFPDEHIYKAFQKAAIKSIDEYITMNYSVPLQDSNESDAQVPF